MITRRASRIAVAAITAVAAAVLILGSPATAAPPEPGVGQGRISAFMADGDMARFVYSAVNLPEDVGLDAGAVEASFTPAGGEPVTLNTSVEVADSVNRRIVLALDVSGSLGPEGIAAVRDAATAFVQQSPAGSEIGLVTFGQPATVVLEPTQDTALVLQEIARLERNGNTALYDAVMLATGLLTGEGSELILLMTDGQDEGDAPGTIGSRASLQQAADAVSGSGAAITAVAFGAASQDPLTTLANAGGGQAVIPAGNPAALTAAFETVVRGITTGLLVDLQVPEQVRGVEGTLTVTVAAGDQLTRATRTGAIGAAPPVVTPDATPSPSPVQSDAAAPVPPPADRRLLIPKAFLYVAIGGLFVALLAVAAVTVGLLSRRNSPEAARRRSLAVYSLRGRRSPAMLQKETADTRLGDNAVARSAVDFAGRVVDKRGLGERLGRKLDAAGIPLRAAEWLVLQTASVLAGGALLMLLSGGNGLALLLGFVLGFAVPQLVLSVRRTRRERAFIAVLPDTLGLMASGLRAGYSMPQAMDSVGREGQEPLRTEFNRALVEARLGVPPEEAMEGIADRMNSTDFRWVVMAIRIQREVGGNLAELLDTVSATLRERARLHRQVQTLSAEGRLSAWILGGLPVGFTIYLLVVRPSYVAVLYTDPLGIALSVVALIVFSIGVLGLRWAIKVDI